MPVLAIHQLQKSYQLAEGGQLAVLKGINVSFDRGDFVSILGESGGGKTTFMNIIAGLDSQYSGNVVFNNHDLRTMTTKQLDQYRRENIGFIFQSFNLISHLTILENVLVGLEMTDFPKSQQLEIAKRLLQRVGLGQKLKAYPNQLSGGQKQRVAIARALANDPDIIIADEPTGALDAANTTEILELLEEIAKDGKLVIAVTHSQTVADYGTRVVHLDNGILDRDERLKPAFTTTPNKLAYHSKQLGFMATFHMALKHMRHNLGSNALIIFGGIVGIFSVLLMLSLGSGVNGFIQHEIAGNLNPTSISVTKKVKDNDISSIAMNQSDIKKMRAIKHVAHVEKAYYAPSVQVKYHQKNVTTSYFQTQNRSFLTKNLSAGRNATGLNEIIISKDLAKKYSNQAPKSMIGRHVTFYINTYDNQHRPVLLSRSLKVVGIMKTAKSATASWATVASMARAKGINLKASLLVVTIDRLANVKTVQNKVKAAHYQLTGVGSMLDTINNYVKLASYLLAGIAGISLLVSAIMIIVVLYIGVGARTKEIGILRALGASRADIRSLFFSESLILGTLFSSLGALVAWGATLGINAASSGFVHYDIAHLNIGFVVFGVTVGILISLIAALAPSWKAARLDPVTALSVE
ncbi:ABC transporter ATP-binding protein/permease [Levilactobacillus acidifarinae]|uniref:Phosphonate-transporting ATPase n=1 Tax=Levilactobacillus acidifarinae DSM 19394 = JCM 15949 TaxID=1423715 RepID=A0A0R1LGL7_9LACO|nr:ABC transporter ATP-binding protein/permease [Levilactobacillus acidifarinae]KRK95022.1 phosphonate-transporting ATPase [Levilactobacillus acidifarinae DSM 19394]GEO70583.1 ABC transporter ATP-binding protein [Levilactobacillus acidifarinae]